MSKTASEYADLTEALGWLARNANQDCSSRWTDRVLLAALGDQKAGLVALLAQHRPDPPGVTGRAAFCNGCSFVHWDRCGVVKMARAVVQAGGNV